MKCLNISFKDEQSLIDFVHKLADAGLIPDGADVYPRDSLDRNHAPLDYLIRSTKDGRTNGILGRVPHDRT